MRMLESYHTSHLSRWRRMYYPLSPNLNFFIESLAHASDNNDPRNLLTMSALILTWLFTPFLHLMERSPMQSFRRHFRFSVLSMVPVL